MIKIQKMESIETGMTGDMKLLVEELLKEHIPFSHIVRTTPSEYIKEEIALYGVAGNYMRNQVVYYNKDGIRKFDCIMQSGSYGCERGNLETYGDLGADEDGQPQIMEVKDIVDVLKKDWQEKITKTHSLKILPQWFHEIAIGRKEFELRKNDRDFRVGDRLLLQEWEDGKYTGRNIIKEIKYLYSGNGDYGLAEGYCILGLK